MVVKQLIEPNLIRSSFQTPMVTGRENRLWTPLALRASGAGSMIGFLNLISKVYLIISRTIFCSRRFEST